MARTGRPKTELTLTEQEGEQLVRWSRRAKSSQALALRSKIVLACAKGTDNKDVASQLNCAVATVGKWRSRFVAERLDGLVDEPRPGGRPRSGSIRWRLSCSPRWRRRRAMPRTGLGRRWPGARGCPRRRSGGSGRPSSSSPTGSIPSSCPMTRCSWRRSTTSWASAWIPAESAVVLCVDEKCQVQALARTSPVLPMMPGMPERATHDYVRHGVPNLFAAFNVADGTVISSIHRRHRAIEFKKFLAKIDDEVPDDLD